ncbi:MAG TPA: tetratricopeptide repeat protein, partial [Planctomycetota bacterium]|nr:tetratricopeptide repeat protein [Planctomycetota bacterium]
PDADPNELARVRVFLAHRALELGRFEEARVALELGLASLENLGGLQSAAGVAALRTHAMVLERSGTLAQSLAAYRRAAELAGAVLGEGHELTLVTRSELASVLSVAGEVEAAELFARSSHEQALADFGPDSQVTLQTGMRLGLVLLARGKFVEGLPLQRSITAGIARVHGESHRNHVQALCALTQALLATRELREAEDQALLAVELRELHHPDDVDLEILTLGALASVLERAGRYSEAREVLATAVERLEQAQLLDHPSGVQFLTRLGEAHLAQGARTDAHAAFEQALSHAVGVFEPEHPWVQRASNGLARATP